MDNNSYKKRRTVMWVIIVAVLLIVTNLATYCLCTYLPVFTGSSAVIESDDKQTKANVEKLLYLIDQLDENFLWDIDKDKLWDGIFKGLLSATGDIYSEYMNAEEYEEYQVTLDGSFFGIGVQISNDENGNVKVVSVFKDSPAYKAGIKVGDIIIGADGEDLYNQSVSYAVKFLRGEENTVVNVEILRDGEELSFNILREEIEMVYVNSKMLDDDIGYINITEFETNTYSQFSQAVKQLDAEGMKGLILDLRQNPGGMVKEAVQIADDLLPKCQIIYTMNKKGERSSYDSDEYCLGLPLVVLVDEYSASSSEILTIALKDNNAATIVGTTSYGKGIVQVLIPLSDGSLYKYTYAEYYGPSGNAIHGEGITPDYVVEQSEEYTNTLISDIPYDNDLQLQKAVEVMEEKIEK